MTPGDAAALLETVGPICRKHGIIRLKIEELEVEFAAAEKPVAAKELEKLAEAFAKSVPSEEEVLFHSAPGGALVEDGEERN